MLQDSGYFELVSPIHECPGIPLVCCRLKPEAHGQKLPFDEYDIMHTVSEKGWVVPAYKVHRYLLFDYRFP